MKDTELTKAIDKATEVKLQAVDKLVKELIKPLEKIGNPEDVLGKPYEQWSPQDLNIMITLYGQGDNTPLSNLIFRKTYKRVTELEAEEADYA